MLPDQQVGGFGLACRHPVEFSVPGNTYCQVMFESPDQILLEVVYTGPKAYSAHGCNWRQNKKVGLE